MGCLTRDDLAKINLRRERVDLPECGNGSYVYIRELTIREGEKLAGQSMDTPESRMAAMGHVLIAALTDDDGNPLLKAGDTGVIQRLPMQVVKRLSDKALELSGLSGIEDEDEEAKN